jgi:hypothetical protein
MEKYKRVFKEASINSDWESLEEGISYPRGQKIYAVSNFVSQNVGSLNERYMTALLAAKGNAKMYIHDGKSIEFRDSSNNYICLYKETFKGFSVEESDNQTIFFVYSDGYATTILFK